MKVHLPGLHQLDAVLDQFLAFGQTTTSLVQSSPVPPRGLPLPGKDAGSE
jgi:Lrp/AsnC family leucine-responsive transcriptional regulator